MKTIEKSLRVVDDEISQSRLKFFRARRTKINKLKALLDPLIAAEEEETREFQEMIEAGCTVQRGKLHLKVYLTKGQRRPKWRELFKKYCGGDAVLREIANTEPGKDTVKMEVV